MNKIINRNNIMVLAVIVLSFVVMFYFKQKPETKKFELKNDTSNISVTLSEPITGCEEVDAGHENAKKYEYNDEKTSTFIQAYVTIIKKSPNGSIQKLNDEFFPDKEYSSYEKRTDTKILSKIDNKEFSFKYKNQDKKGICDGYNKSVTNGKAIEYSGTLIYAVELENENYLWVSVSYSSQKHYNMENILKTIIE